ncbi:O-antigen ligase family protein [Tistrella mobilis]|uniref:O-antigen ligase family protein n=1 Tax=Tistrella mobilis TaxID=171437 RepID=UPI003557DD5E
MSDAMVRPRPARKSYDGVYSVLFGGLLFVSVFVMGSRGLFEVVAGKAVAYVLQLAMLSLLITACLMSRRVSPTSWLRSISTLLVVFAASALASAIITLETEHVTYGFIYVFVFLYISIILSFFAGFRCPMIETSSIRKSFVIMGLLLAFFGIAQQIGLVRLPGGSAVALLRPSSLTGSYLHYPIILALFTLSMLQIHNATGKWRYLAYAVFMGAAIFASFSRSGMSIIMGSIFFFYLFYYIRQNIEVKAIMYVVAALSVPVLILGIVIFAQQSAVLERIVSIVDIESGGNSRRSEIWTSTVSVFLDGPILLGDQTGLYTNITDNLLGVDAAVAESGFLQHLVNVGLIGCLSFYALFVFVYKAIDPSHLWLRAVVMTAALQSFIYQSIEVFPYMAILGLMPVLSRHLAAIEQERRRRRSASLSLLPPFSAPGARAAPAE